MELDDIKAFSRRIKMMLLTMFHLDMNGQWRRRRADAVSGGGETLRRAH
jgi:hypothetical protein